MGDYIFQFQKIHKSRMRRLGFVMGIMASAVLVFQIFTLPSRHAFSPFFPAFKKPFLEERSFPRKDTSKSTMVGKVSLLSDSQNSSYSSIVLKAVEASEVSITVHGFNIKEIDGDRETDDSDDGVDLDEDEDPNDKFSYNLEGAISKKIRDPVGDSLIRERIVDKKDIASPKKAGGLDTGSIFVLDGASKPNLTLLFEQIKNLANESVSLPLAYTPIASNNPGRTTASVISSSGEDTTETVASSGKRVKETPFKNEALMPLQSVSAHSNLNKRNASITWVKKRMPPMYISDMNPLLLRNRASNQSMKPRWSSACDKQILAAKEQIENAPLAKNDRELYAPLFRNISTFKRSYDLMERTLKIYVYKQGQKPIFHEPLLKGIYASEGWFMKLMQTNRHFVVKDPSKAHLFYMPFSSRYLRLALYKPELHNWRYLEQYLENYVDVIAAKYPFWNRTGGEDHFLVACHDWAPFETRHTMEHSIRALCTADPRSDFRLGKDVSLPETNVRSPWNPLKGLGGRPANRRPTLAFFSGKMHGGLRPKLLLRWENKDPDMKIFGPLTGGGESNMTYVQHMKTSKYCICPRGHEVNSPRIVESIFYECVPVIISNSYVPPFFEVLNWEAFSVILPEKNLPRLKEILVSIPRKKYLALQMGVRKVQKHFLWHSKPVKYDLFHMILHSIWFNRVNQIRPYEGGGIW